MRSLLLKKHYDLWLCIEAVPMEERTCPGGKFSIRAASEKLEIRQDSYAFLPCRTKNFLTALCTFPSGTASKSKLAAPIDGAAADIRSLFYTQHPVSDADMRLNILRGVRLLFQFFAQRSHKHAQRGNIVIPASIPDLLGNKRVR